MKPTPRIPLVIYISVAEEVVSFAMILQVVERRYQRIEKVALSLVIASRRLCMYFQGHSIIVRTDLPIKQVLKKSNLVGRMVAWSVQLSEFDISYESKGHIKAEALADFITKMTAGSLEAKTSGGWLLLVDEASNQVGSGVGVILEGSNGVLIEQSHHFEFKASNNQVEYEAFAGTRLAKELEAKVLTAKSDWKLMTRQVNGEYQAKDPQLVKYLDRTVKLAIAFEKFTLHHKRGVQKSIIHKSIGRPTTKELEVGCIEERTTWMSPLMAYLRDEIKSEDPIKAKKLIKEAARYIIIEGELYRRGFSFPLLRCI
ncbi:hypothetical protein CR513_16433, partial [Mucuna pruriens]